MRTTCHVFLVDFIKCMRATCHVFLVDFIKCMRATCHVFLVDFIKCMRATCHDFLVDFIKCMRATCHVFLVDFIKCMRATCHVFLVDFIKCMRATCHVFLVDFIKCMRATCHVFLVDFIKCMRATCHVFLVDFIKCRFRILLCYKYSLYASSAHACLIVKGNMTIEHKSSIGNPCVVNTWSRCRTTALARCSANLFIWGIHTLPCSRFLCLGIHWWPHGQRPVPSAYGLLVPEYGLMVSPADLPKVWHHSHMLVQRILALKLKGPVH